MAFRIVMPLDAPYPPTMLTAADIRWSMRSQREQDIVDVFDDPNIIDAVVVRSELVRPKPLVLPPSREPGEDG